MGQFPSETQRGEKAVILLDEYDVPLENAYLEGFYEEMADFVRSLFESALKSNDSLAFAVVTGCLRISKESIFTGLNNLKVVSLLSSDYGDCFGFTPTEVEKMLGDYGLSHKEEEVEKWYDGYLFGKTQVYNPWSIINYLYDRTIGGETFPKPYWSNTSGNGIIRELVEEAGPGTKQEIEDLIAGGTIRKPVHEEITYGDVHASRDNLWNFLFFTGYLKMAGRHFGDGQIYLDLAIPNEEIRYIYRNVIRQWFGEVLERVDFQDFYRDVLRGNSEGMEEFLSKQLEKSISYYDSGESFYHGYMTGILGGLEGYEVRSNRESGAGRPDLLLSPFNPKKPAVVMELKRTDKFQGMEQACREALDQIERQGYDSLPKEEGYAHIIKYGICFCKKSCMVKKGMEVPG